MSLRINGCVMVHILSTGDFVSLSYVYSMRSMTAEGLRSELRVACCDPASHSYTSVSLLCLNMLVCHCQSILACLLGCLSNCQLSGRLLA